MLTVLIMDLLYEYFHFFNSRKGMKIRNFQPLWSKSDEYFFGIGIYLIYNSSL